MKVLLHLLIVFIFAVLPGSGCCRNNYNLLLLGDLHYDAPEFHDNRIMQFKEHVPYMQGVMNKDGNFSLRNHTFWVTEAKAISHKNIKLNTQMWQTYMPQLLTNAACTAKENNALYILQLGDIIHGDCGRFDLHQKNLQQAVDTLDKYFTAPVLTVCGNHDPRGPHGQEAWDKTMIPYLKKIVPDISETGANYHIRIGKDLFYFHDLMKPDLDYMEKVFNENPDTRYTFFITHVLLMPMDRGSFNNILADDFHRIFKLLESRNAIVLGGHTHQIALTEYYNQVSERRITQFVLNSTVRRPDKEFSFHPGTDARKKNVQTEEFYVGLWEKYFAGKLKTTLHTNGSGHALLRVADDGVWVDYYNIGQETPYTFKLR